MTTSCVLESPSLRRDLSIREKFRSWSSIQDLKRLKQALILLSLSWTTASTSSTASCPSACRLKMKILQASVNNLVRQQRKTELPSLPCSLSLSLPHSLTRKSGCQPWSSKYTHRESLCAQPTQCMH